MARGAEAAKESIKSIDEADLSALLKAVAKGALTQEVLDQAQEHTTSLRATKGRASYYGERSIGEKDPGATSSAYLFEALMHQL